MAVNVFDKVAILAGRVRALLCDRHQLVMPQFDEDVFTHVPEDIRGLVVETLLQTEEALQVVSEELSPGAVQQGQLLTQSQLQLQLHT